MVSYQLEFNENKWFKSFHIEKEKVDKFEAECCKLSDEIDIQSLVNFLIILKFKEILFFILCFVCYTNKKEKNKAKKTFLFPKPDPKDAFV